MYCPSCVRIGGQKPRHRLPVIQLTFILAVCSSFSIIMSVAAAANDLQQQQQQSPQSQSDLGKSNDFIKETPVDAYQQEEQEEFEKRASGFMPMRGRKSSFMSLEDMAAAAAAADDRYDDGGGELEFFDLLDKRGGNRFSSSQFMPMRGRRAQHPYYAPRPVPYWWPSLQRLRWRSNAAAAGRTGSGAGSFDTTDKRAKGVAFFGSRGKRSSSAWR